MPGVARVYIESVRMGAVEIEIEFEIEFESVGMGAVETVDASFALLALCFLYFPRNRRAAT